MKRSLWALEIINQMLIFYHIPSTIFVKVCCVGSIKQNSFTLSLDTKTFNYLNQRNSLSVMSNYPTEN